MKNNGFLYLPLHDFKENSDFTYLLLFALFPPFVKTQCVLLDFSEIQNILKSFLLLVLLWFLILVLFYLWVL